MNKGWFLKTSSLAYGGYLILFFLDHFIHYTGNLKPHHPIV